MPKPQHHYEPPVDRLLRLGESWVPPEEWPDYPSMGLGPDDVPELLRLATDRRIYHSTSRVRHWAPVHAWRALAQLGAVEAIEPLVAFLREEDSDAANEDIPRVLARLGAPGMEAFIRLVNDPAEEERLRIAASEGLGEVAGVHPELRDACVDALVARLERFEENSRELNAFLLLPLVELRALSAAALIERAYAANAVDESLLGDWEDVQVELGLKEQRETPRPNYVFRSLRRNWQQHRKPQEEEMPDDLAEEGAPAPPRTPPARRSAHAKSRKKMEKQSRRKNRRR